MASKHRLVTFPHIKKVSQSKTESPSENLFKKVKPKNHRNSRIN